MAPRQSPVSTSPHLNAHAATLAVDACAAEARRIGVPMNIAVVSPSLHLLGFLRMDGAKLTSISIALNKAFTAAGHRLPTHAYTADKVGPGAPMYGVHHSNDGRFTTIGGGVPVLVSAGGEDVCVGAVGCSTGSPDQDRQVAEAGVRAISEALGTDGAVKAKL